MPTRRYVDYWEELVPRVRPGGVLLGRQRAVELQVVEPGITDETLPSFPGSTTWLQGTSGAKPSF